MRITSNVAALMLGAVAITAMPVRLWAQDEEKLVSEAKAEEETRLNSPVAKLMRSTHRIEKGFLLRACQLEPAQRRELEKLDDSWKEAIPGSINAGAGRLAGGADEMQRLPGGADALRRLQAAALIQKNRSNVSATALQKYRDSLHERFVKILTPEQRRVYEAEVKAREQFAHQVGVESVVAILDQSLDLEPEQCAALTKALAEQPGYEQFHAAFYLLNEGPLPHLPEELAAKHLTKEQSAIYRQAQQVDVSKSRNIINTNEILFGE